MIGRKNLRKRQDTSKFGTHGQQSRDGNVDSQSGYVNMNPLIVRVWLRLQMNYERQVR